MEENVLDIGEVARLTGLTTRALRFYEARGLITATRTLGGRRVFGPEAISRLHALIALKRAGFSLAGIARVLDGKSVDLARLIAAQKDELDQRAAEIDDTRRLLSTILSRIDRGEPVDVATLCSLIHAGNNMEQDNWKRVTDRYMSAEVQGEFAEQLTNLPADFDPIAYQEKWRELGARIEAALPLDPASDEAFGFLEEWQALLAPFVAVATPGMLKGATNLYERMGEWEGEADPGFSAEVFGFIQEVSRQQKAV